MEEVERLFRQLVKVLSEDDPDRVRVPIQISEIYQSVLPYRHHRSALGFDTNEDYEMTLLRFLAGAGGFASIDPPEVQDALASEAQSVNPKPGTFREYAAAKVFLNAGAVRTVIEAHEAYAPPGDYDDEPDELPLNAVLPFEPKTPFTPDPTSLDLAMAETRPMRAGSKPEFPAPELGLEPEPALPTCRQCGGLFPVGRDVRFCPHCGKATQITQCPSCSDELDANWRFCVTCGYEVGQL